MPTSYLDQFNKYKLKYSGANVTAVLTAIKDTVMVPRFQVATQLIVQDREKVRQILEENGVPPGLHGIYYAFGFALSSAKFSHTGATLQTIASALKARFAGMGADTTILNAIAAALTGYAPYY
ncbi:MAG: hypothetical protein DSO07_05275 [Thermoproteota archaeon]|nr:MAG: hypothetical protein DSO07_05275 [Candidatus Korarchaeota archaeon]